MKANALRILALCLAITAPTAALGQSGCGGQFATMQFCGNPTGATGLPRPTTIPAGALTPVAGGTVIGNRTTGTAAPAATAAPVLGIPGTTLGTLALSGSSSGQITLQPQAAAGTYNFNLPTSAGSTGQVFQSGGGGATANTWSTATYPATATGTGTILRADGTNWVATTATYPATTTVNEILFSSSANVIGGLTTANGGLLNTGATGVPSLTATPTLGVTGSTLGTMTFSGNTSGAAVVTPQAAAGSPTLTLPNTSGTFAVGATSPLALSATTGNLTCATCVTSSGGGAVTGVAPVAVSAGGAVSITGAAGQVLAGASPAFTNAPALGVAGSSVGSIAFANATSGSVTIQPITGALGTSVLSLPAATDTLVGKATTDIFTNKTYDTAGTGNSFSINGVAATANSGTGSVVRATSPALVTPALGVATATSLAVGGATIGSDALAVTGTATISGNSVFSGALTTARVSVTGSTLTANGLYLPSANTLGISTNSTQRFTVTSAGLLSADAAGAQVTSSAASATVPALIPNKADATTGLGAQAAGNISLIAGGAEQARITSTGINNAAIGATTASTGAFTAFTASGVANLSGALKLSTQSAPAQITADQNNYNPSSVNCTTSATLLINSDAARNVTGLGGGVAGCRMQLVNNGSFTITLKELDGGSTAANQFNMGGDFSLAANGAVTLVYDGAASRWRNSSSLNASAGTGTVTSVVCGDGLSGGTITTSGTCAVLGYSLKTITTINASTTYTVPANVRALYVIVKAGGGGGGYAIQAGVGTVGAGGGGGGGACSAAFLSSLSASYTVTIGAAGAGGVASGPTAPTAGGDTSFGTAVVAVGGAAAGVDTATASAHVGGSGGPGGSTVSGTGDTKYRGNTGLAGFTLSTTDAIGGAPGANPCNGGAIQQRTSAGAGADAEANTGSGGSGAFANSTTSRNGGAGGTGQVIVYEYY